MDKTLHIKALRNSLRAAEASALSARRRYRAACEQHDFESDDTFMTAAEVAKLEREHEAKVVRIICELTSPTWSAHAREIVTAVRAWSDRKDEPSPETQDEIDWHRMVGEAERIVAARERERATRAAADVIARAGRKRRNRE
jgi:hypothetical protein